MCHRLASSQTCCLGTCTVPLLTRVAFCAGAACGFSGGVSAGSAALRVAVLPGELFGFLVCFGASEGFLARICP